MPSKSSLFFPAGDARIGTEIGFRQDGAIVVANDKEGCFLYGPYVDLPKGKYRANVIFSERSIFKGEILVDVCADLGKIILKSGACNLAQARRNAGQLPFDFSLDEPTPQCEVRLYCSRGVSATVTGVEIVRLDPDVTWGRMSTHGSRPHHDPELATAPDVVGDDVFRPAAKSTFETQVLERLERLERLAHGGHATYVGNNRVLAKVVVSNACRRQTTDAACRDPRRSRTLSDQIFRIGHPTWR
jgi:hypothetical protein